MELQRILEKAKEETDTDIHEWEKAGRGSAQNGRVLQLKNDALKRELDELTKKQIKLCEVIGCLPRIPRCCASFHT